MFWALGKQDKKKKSEILDYGSIQEHRSSLVSKESKGWCSIQGQVKGSTGCQLEAFFVGGFLKGQAFRAVIWIN